MLLYNSVRAIKLHKMLYLQFLSVGQQCLAMIWEIEMNHIALADHATYAVRCLAQTE